MVSWRDIFINGLHGFEVDERVDHARAAFVLERIHALAELGAPFRDAHGEGRVTPQRAQRDARVGRAELVGQDRGHDADLERGRDLPP